ncbi:hypothetical protein HK099_008164 [Clydaea vesicula]|uniref:FAD dependent oxidoreductase domain-containing protein n=1 Tax=Clydaea vesicula TaxID=447962 RepID=A0AAD5U6C3_9FUNG|nr:hypothetical protein HK099_008164 [Clydaea vesicula]
MNKIVLIGGGIISACTAHYLQELDPKLQLVIIEKASGKAGGFLSRVMCSSSTALKKLSQKSFDLHSDLAEKFNGEVNYDYRRVCVSTRDYVEKDHLTFKKINDTKIGDVNNSAQLNPSSFTNYLVRQNKQLTVKIGDFLDLVKINGKITGIKYQQEDKILFEECDKVVFCTGPWTNQIFDKIGLECPVTIVPHCAESIVVKSDHSSKEMLFIEVCKGNEVRSLEVYPRPNSTIYLCGDGQPFGIEEDIPRPLLDPTEVQPNTSFLNEILKLAKMVELGLEEKSVFKMQACFVPYSHSGAPYIGETHVENVYLAAGHGCWGILNAPATGLALSELIVHGASKLLNSFGM